MAALKQSGLPATLSPLQRRLVQAIEQGLPLVSRPYEALAQKLGVTERDIIGMTQQLLDKGLIKRFGVVVRHRQLGYIANGMVVWDIPDRDIDRVGSGLSRSPAVTLCYRRPRCPPRWPYNLFTMVHGRDRAEVRQQVEALAGEHGLDDTPRAILFSNRCFKQRGARYGCPTIHEDRATRKSIEQEEALHVAQ